MPTLKFIYLYFKLSNRPHKLSTCMLRNVWDTRKYTLIMLSWHVCLNKEYNNLKWETENCETNYVI